MNFYTEAIGIVGDTHKKAAAYLCNRAMCHLKTESYRNLDY